MHVYALSAVCVHFCTVTPGRSRYKLILTLLSSFSDATWVKSPIGISPSWPSERTQRDTSEHFPSIHTDILPVTNQHLKASGPGHFYSTVNLKTQIIIYSTLKKYKITHTKDLFLLYCLKIDSQGPSMYNVLFSAKPDAIHWIGSSRASSSYLPGIGLDRCRYVTCWIKDLSNKHSLVVVHFLHNLGE